MLTSALLSFAGLAHTLSQRTGVQLCIHVHLGLYRLY